MVMQTFFSSTGCLILGTPSYRDPNTCFSSSIVLSAKNLIYMVGVPLYTSNLTGKQVEEEKYLGIGEEGGVLNPPKNLIHYFHLIFLLLISLHLFRDLVNSISSCSFDFHFLSLEVHLHCSAVYIFPIFKKPSSCSKLPYIKLLNYLCFLILCIFLFCRDSQIPSTVSAGNTLLTLPTSIASKCCSSVDTTRTI